MTGIDALPAALQSLELHAPAAPAAPGNGDEDSVQSSAVPNGHVEQATAARILQLKAEALHSCGFLTAVEGVDSVNQNTLRASQAAATTDQAFLEAGTANAAAVLGAILASGFGMRTVAALFSKALSATTATSAPGSMAIAEVHSLVTLLYFHAQKVSAAISIAADHWGLDPQLRLSASLSSGACFGPRPAFLASWDQATTYLYALPFRGYEPFRGLVKRNIRNRTSRASSLAACTGKQRMSVLEMVAALVCESAWITQGLRVTADALLGAAPAGGGDQSMYKPAVISRAARQLIRLMARVQPLWQEFDECDPVSDPVSAALAEFNAELPKSFWEDIPLDLREHAEREVLDPTGEPSFAELTCGDWGVCECCGVVPFYRQTHVMGPTAPVMCAYTYRIISDEELPLLACQGMSTECLSNAVQRIYGQRKQLRGRLAQHLQQHQG